MQPHSTCLQAFHGIPCICAILAQRAKEQRIFFAFTSQGLLHSEKRNMNCRNMRRQRQVSFCQAVQTLHPSLTHRCKPQLGGHELATVPTTRLPRTKSIVHSLSFQVSREPRSWGGGPLGRQSPRTTAKPSCRMTLLPLGSDAIGRREARATGAKMRA